VPADGDDEDRARKTAPAQVSVSSSGREVLAKEPIAARTRFGPFQGKILYGVEAGAFSWEVSEIKIIAALTAFRAVLISTV